MFYFNRNTVIDYSSLSELTKPILNAVRILERDIQKCFLPSNQPTGYILLQADHMMPEEAFQLAVSDTICLTAGDDLGFVYGLLYISEEYLGIKPFWFFLDQQIVPVKEIQATDKLFISPKPFIRFRGWFFNDEVLFSHWQVYGDSLIPWKMGFEALLRCGGNMAIPGTDKNSRKYRQLASDMGLWITHHHAEPLGAEMFVRAFPDKEPSYDDYSNLFYQLWEQAVIEQKNYKVIWNLGFRGQGDCPFWSNDKSGNYNTAKKRGELISELIEKQRQLVLKYIKNPVFCTNLYGEVMELYQEGYIHFDKKIIKVYADNGYGKMVTRRRDNHCARIPALPLNPKDTSGIYYHVSFYDLQAASHITMLPNSVDFVNSALTEALEHGANDYWIINCSNVRPHVYYLDAIRKKWHGMELSAITHSLDFTKDYYNGEEGIAPCLSGYADAMLSYGKEDDEHAGEQFYNENIRLLINHIIRNRTDTLSGFRWFTGDIPLPDQLSILFGICHKGESRMETYYQKCKDIGNQLSGHVKQLFEDTILMQAKIHNYCLKGMLLCEQACKAYWDQNYLQAFLNFGKSASFYEQANAAMRDSEHGIWKGFYQNDCLADIKHTAYMLRKMMGIAREMGDNARHDKWYRDIVYSIEDRRVMTILVNDNHMTDQELWETFMEKQLNIFG